MLLRYVKTKMEVLVHRSAHITLILKLEVLSIAFSRSLGLSYSVEVHEACAEGS